MHRHPCARLLFSAPQNLSLFCFSCVCVLPSPLDVVFVTLPHKCAVKGMKLVIINHDTIEGEKR